VGNGHDSLGPVGSSEEGLNRRSLSPRLC
jgi:hypothetical protein